MLGEPLRRALDSIAKLTSAGGPKRRILGTPDSIFVPTYKNSDIFNEKAIDREIGDSAKALKLEQDKLKGIVITARSPNEVKEHARWQESQQKVWTVVDFLANLDEEYSTIVSRAESGEQPMTMGQFSLYHTLHLGGKLIIEKLLEAQYSYMSRKDLGEEIRPYITLQRFVFEREHTLRLGGVSLNEIADPKTAKTLPPSTVLSFLMEATLVRYRRSHKDVLKANQTYPINTYPNMTLQAIEGLGAEMMAISNMDSRSIDNIVSGNTGFAREAAQSAKRFYEQLQGMLQDFYRSITDPKSPSSKTARETLEHYLRLGKYERITALYTIGLSQTALVYSLYRRANELSHGDLAPSFYQLLSTSVLEYVNEMSETQNVLTIDDVPTLLTDNGETLEEQNPPSTQTLGKIISAIFSKSSVREYRPNPEGIAFEALAKPQNIEVTFDKNRPQKCSITLSYKNDVGETLDFNLNLDATRGFFDWNFVEVPTDPRMQGIYTVSMRAAQAVLSSIQENVEEAYNQRKAQKVAQPTQPNSSSKRERTSDEIYDIRKEMRTQARARRQETAEETMPAPTRMEEEAIKKRILLPETKVIENMLEHVGPQDRPTIKDGIIVFNERGVGEFTRKRRKNPNGEILYTLRVNCSVPKGARVLMREVKTLEERTRDFEILDIRYRKDTYRKAGI